MIDVIQCTKGRFCKRPDDNVNLQSPLGYITASRTARFVKKQSGPEHKKACHQRSQALWGAISAVQ